MAKEYIERSEMESILHNRYDKLEGFGPDFYAGYMMAFHTIEDDVPPAADVVEVVRCRECKHSYRIDGAKEEYDCAKISAFAKFFPGDHFCSYGERKTDG